MSVILIIFMKGVIVRTQVRMFGINEENLTFVLYGSMAIYKILIIVFNAVPYVVLRFMV